MPHLNPKEALAYLRWNRLGHCTRCSYSDGRKHILFGEGPPEASVLVVTEAPSKKDDRKGEFLSGRPGQLLTWLLEQAQIPTHQVYRAPVVKCVPLAGSFGEAMQKCSPFLHGQVWLIKPKVIITLGLTASNLMSKRKLTLRQLRSSELTYSNPKTGLSVPVVASFSLSYVLNKHGSISEKQCRKSMISDFCRAATYLV